MLDIAADRSKKSNIYVINLRGRVDFSGTAHDFEAYFEGLLKEGRRFLILEASGVEFISSAGIAALVRLIRRLDALEGAGAFVSLNEEISMVLDFFKLSSYLPFYNSLQEAREFLSERIRKGTYTLEMDGEEELAPVPEKKTVAPQPTREEPATVAAKPAPVPPSKNEPRPILPESQGKILGEPAETPMVSAVPVTSMEPATLRDAVKESLRELLEERDRKEEAKKRKKARLASPTPNDASRPDLGRRSRAMPQETEASRDLAAYLSGENKTATATAIPRQNSEAPAPLTTRVLPCQQCGSQLRIRKPGNYQCPACSIKFNVSKTGFVSFYEKL